MKLKKKKTLVNMSVPRYIFKILKCNTNKENTAKLEII